MPHEANSRQLPNGIVFPSCSAKGATVEEVLADAIETLADWIANADPICALHWMAHQRRPTRGGFPAASLPLRCERKRAQDFTKPLARMIQGSISRKSRRLWREEPFRKPLSR